MRYLVVLMTFTSSMLFYVGYVEPSSPAGPMFDDDDNERDLLLGNDGDVPVEEEGEGEELFGDNFERYVWTKKDHLAGRVEVGIDNYSLIN